MKTTDVFGSGATLATAIFTATNASTSSAQAEAIPANSQSTFAAKTKDILDVSQLASSLNGDGLTLFNNLSTDTRQGLADLVFTGKMKADQLNDALSGLLKSARKTAFWNEAAKAQSHLPDDVKAAQSALSGNVKQNAERIEQMGSASSFTQTGYLTGADAERARAQFDNLRAAKPDASAVGQAQTLTQYGMSYDYAAWNSVSESEAAAAQKLKETGFSSSDLDSVLQNFARDAVNRLIEG
ncbi:MAG: hypothetical protein E6Q98_26675 [Rhodospirillaceae bacterium]|nr:MAG: hypothetical protein E6Q98_26675 [Rhodospirillaceae bacterium]